MFLDIGFKKAHWGRGSIGQILGIFLNRDFGRSIAEFPMRFHGVAAPNHGFATSFFPVPRPISGRLNLRTIVYDFGIISLNGCKTDGGIS